MRCFLLGVVVILLASSHVSADVISTASTSITVNYQSTSNTNVEVSISILPPEVFGFSDVGVLTAPQTSATNLSPASPTSALGPLLEASADVSVTTSGNAIPAAGDWVVFQTFLLSFENPTASAAEVAVGGTFFLNADTTTDEPLPSFGIAEAAFDVAFAGESLFERSAETFTDFGPPSLSSFGDWSVDFTIDENSIGDLEITTTQFVSATSVKFIPEPSAITMLLMMLAVVGCQREPFTTRFVR